MSTELAKREETGIRMADLSPEYAEIMVLGNVLQKSGYFKDVRDQAQAVTKILFGRELGFSPIVAMGGIHIIEGKPALSSNLMATLIKRSGKYDYRVKSWTHTECVLTFREKNGTAKFEDVGESSFTMEDAKAAGVVRQGGSWSKFPKAMLFARALSQGLRTYCPDVSASPIYNPEEMGAEVSEEGEVVELPKSARPVARTTEDIPLSAPINKDQGGKPVAEGKPVAANPPAGAEKIVVAEIVEEAKLSVGYISVKEQKEFHAACRGAVEPSQRTKADGYTYQWLMDNHYLNSKGEPSASAIPAKDWPQARDRAKTWVGVQ